MGALLRTAATASSCGAGGLIFVRRIHDVSCEFPGRPFSSVNSTHLRLPTSGCSRRDSLLHLAATAGPGKSSNKDGWGGSSDDKIGGVLVEVENTERKKEHTQEQINPNLMMRMLKEIINSVELGRRSCHLFDELWRQLSGFASEDQNIGTQFVMRALGDDPWWKFVIPGTQNTTFLLVDAPVNVGRNLMRRVYRAKRFKERLRGEVEPYQGSFQLQDDECVKELASGKEIDFALVSCAGSGLGIKPTRREHASKDKKVALPPHKENNCLIVPGSLIQENISVYCGGKMAGAVVNLLAAAFVLSAFNPQARAMARPLQQQQNDQNQETLSNIPPFLSPSSPSESKSSQIQHPKSRKAESCTVKCLNTCIRGEDGLGPLNVRRPLVVFKPGFHTRKYCLVECSDICNLLKDGDDGP